MLDRPETVTAGHPIPIRATPGREFGAAHRARVLEPDRPHLESQKVLLPGAAGQSGAPYKMLRTQVVSRLEKLGTNLLSIVSPTEGDGKTLTAINLAIAIAAESGRTSLIVDMDLRNPNVHRRLGIKPETGVEDCLEGRASLRDALVRLEGYERMTVLPAMCRIAHSSELLADRRCAELVAELRERYSNRVIIFDLPPVLQADDALAFSRHVGAGLMVVSEGRTRRDDVVRAIDLLRDVTLVGTVLNGSRERARTYY